MNQAKQTAEFLKQQIAEKGMIDVGTGVERELGISKEKMNQALYILEMEGYPVYGGGVPQVTNPGKQTRAIILTVMVKDSFPLSTSEQKRVIGVNGQINSLLSFFLNRA